MFFLIIIEIDFLEEKGANENLTHTVLELIAIYAEPRYVEDREWVKNNFLPKSDGTMHV